MDKIVIALICVVLLIIYWITKAFSPLKKLVTESKPVESRKTIQLSGFHSSMSANEAKEFLEKHTGEGSVYALKPRQSSKTGGRKRRSNTNSYVVQFTSAKDAEHILKLARKKHLQCGPQYLEAQPMENDVVPNPLIPEHTITNATLHFGCQVSFSKLLVLWKQTDLSLNFGMALKKFYFFLPHGLNMYKLELPYQSILQIQLRHSQDTPSKFLLIQLSGCPLVYEKDDSHQESEDMYVQSAQGENWIRTVDFTPSSCISQSTVLFLELPESCKLADLKQNFPQFKENRSPLILENGTPFSQDSELVPILEAPKEIELPFDILFKVNQLVHNGSLVGSALDLSFFLKIDPRKTDKACIEYALHKLSFKKALYDPVTCLDEQYREYRTSKRRPKQPFIPFDGGLGLVYSRRVQVTPCRVIFCGPEAIVSNRVLRNFADHIDNFIRVSFVDEDLETLHPTDLCPYGGNRTGVDKRIRSVLREGIRIGDKRFEFLAYSNSQLKENSIWMFASTPQLSAADIRRWMGDFSEIKNVAKYAARLGQSLGSSREALGVAKHEMEIIDDVEVETEGKKYVFSDGIGKISSQFAKEVAKKCDIKGPCPSAFQIRYAGFKGVVAVDPTMPSNMKLCLRNSMCKYESENDTLDVLAYSKYQPCHLNRQIITLLSTLGVEDGAFEVKQQEATKQLDAILTDSNKAMEALKMMTSKEIANILREMMTCGYKPDMEPFLSKMLQSLLASKVHELRTRTRIFIPKGRAMMGCLDETNTLEYGQVFVQVSWSKNRDTSKEMLKRSYSRRDVETYHVDGKVVIAKNPCLHPGDVRVLTAVDVPALHHMVDCIVFPQKGPRPHPDECSGSDLDGDIYFVCWDTELIPPRQIDPTDYIPAAATKLDREVTIKEVEDYFVDFIINQSLGMIANAHTVFADKEHEKAMSAPCLKLAKQFSVAVDFPKTGVPAEIPREVHISEYPDFMEKHEKPAYKSENVIGKLFREVRDRVPESNLGPFTKEVATRCYDANMEYDGFREYLEGARYWKGEYDSQLRNFMAYYGIRTEGEILTGSIVRTVKRKDIDAIPLAVKSLRREARGWFEEEEDGSKDVRAKYAKASAWYHVTYHPDYWGTYNEGNNQEHFLSFPWCVHDLLLKIKQGKTLTRSRGRTL